MPGLHFTIRAAHVKPRFGVNPEDEAHFRAEVTEVLSDASIDLRCVLNPGETAIRHNGGTK